MMEENLKIRPYARLLTMLGEQLIKDEQIALMEIIKNSYDADASFVKVIFEKFGDNYEVLPESKIIIQDDGIGMTKEKLSTAFMNPATPNKKIQKQNNNKTAKGRIIQGEKGIGRFAILKLGRKIDVISKTEEDIYEHILHYDFSQYDSDFLIGSEKKEKKEIFLDDLSVRLEEKKPEKIKQQEINLGINKKIIPDHGTVIEISEINKGWNEEKIKKIESEIIKLQTLFDKIYIEDKKNPIDIENAFTVYLYKDNEHIKSNENYKESLRNIIENKAALKIENGFFDNEDESFNFNLNGQPQKLFLADPVLKGINFAKEYFKDVYEAGLFGRRKICCGSFEFSFYIFDFSPKAPSKFLLDKEEKEKVRPHRIYLYRDGIRVYPYGNLDDDWLQIDTFRGTISAGHFLSNDQVIGVIKITHAGNPDLKDKTNREGLLDSGYATSDFIKLLQLFLRYIRLKPYTQYLLDNEKRENQSKIVSKKIVTDFDLLKEKVQDNKEVSNLVKQIENSYSIEKQFLTRRAEITENLAGVGLSVETASHDIMKMMDLALKNLDYISANLTENLNIELLHKDLEELRKTLFFVYAQIKDIQLLFTSSKQRKKDINVKEILSKVVYIYRNVVKEKNIAVNIVEVSEKPLIAKTIDAVLLQVLLNLFDNSIYWLCVINNKDKEILITLDGDREQLIFSDNGPGVKEEDLPYIFESFYSGKGDEGRGLGLYIARQLLERYDYSINYSQKETDRKLSGANFILNFGKGEN